VQGVGNGFQSEATPVDVDGSRASVSLSLTTKQGPELAHAWPGRPPGEGGGETESAGSKPINLPDGGDGKGIALTKCSLCHEADGIANSQMTKEGWKDEIDTMRAYMQGSNTAKDLTDEEEVALLDYVSTNFGPVERSGRAPRVVDPNSRLPRTLMTGPS